MAYDGFTVPNTPDVNGVYDVAEPDAVDFNILGNHRHGVIAGCVATQSGVSSTVNVSAGLAVVNGAVVSVSAQQALVGAALAEARFDLLVVSVSGQVSTIQGAASTNPVLPDTAVARRSRTITRLSVTTMPLAEM
jgi:hypothetical protein